MSTLAKKAGIVTALIFFPMIATNLVLLDLPSEQFKLDGRALIITGAVLAILISWLLWIKSNINNDEHIKDQ